MFHGCQARLLYRNGLRKPIHVARAKVQELIDIFVSDQPSYS